MYIGDLAKRTGASRKAIYLYEEMGLIPTPARKGTYRIYSAETVGIVNTIRCAQSLGFKLKELADTFQNSAANLDESLDEILHRIELKRGALQQQIDTATTRIGLLDQLRQQLVDSPLSWRCEKIVDPSPRGKP